ncbi:MAG: hypothetical protein NZ530_02265 [Thermodesulfobacteriaceae bacterium]|nr:hypothetical protein [Thermodesulfobacteriaceae bacterium]MDW8135835.1 hypothetical protein [Thermodesulfobacterium sp.]
MQCERLKFLIRDWYQQVREFTLSPTKMMELVDRHVKNCETCQGDEELSLELEQLREIIRVPYVPIPKEEREEEVMEEFEYVYEEEDKEEEEY